VLLTAFAGQALRRDHIEALGPAQEFTARDGFGREWSFRSSALSNSRSAASQALILSVGVTAGGEVSEVRPEIRQMLHSHGEGLDEPVPRPDIMTTALMDTHVTFEGAKGEGSAAVADLRSALVPLAVWIWIGGALLLVGGSGSMWPER
jgi:hypothetical protein